MLLLLSADYFQNTSKLYSKNSFWKTIRVANSFDADQDRCSGSKMCLQRLSADNKKRVNDKYSVI